MTNKTKAFFYAKVYFFPLCTFCKAEDDDCLWCGGCGQNVDANVPLEVVHTGVVVPVIVARADGKEFVKESIVARQESGVFAKSAAGIPQLKTAVAS